MADDRERKAAEAKFKKSERATEGAQAMSEYNAERQAERALNRVLYSRCRPYPSETGRATPITPVEIDGAKQVWELSARYAQFRAPAFPRHVPCRSRCRALAGSARARKSYDIRPRALCTPPPKSFALTPDLCTRPMLPWQQGVVSIVSRRCFTSAPIVTFAPQHCALALIKF
jgi:hypothetical protein